MLNLSRSQVGTHEPALKLYLFNLWCHIQYRHHTHVIIFILFFHFSAPCRAKI